MTMDSRTEQAIEYEDLTGRTKKTTDAAGNITEYAYACAPQELHPW
jgi:hypothetical protein